MLDRACMILRGRQQWSGMTGMHARYVRGRSAGKLCVDWIQIREAENSPPISEVPSRGSGCAVTGPGHDGSPCKNP